MARPPSGGRTQSKKLKKGGNPKKRKEQRFDGEAIKGVNHPYSQKKKRPKAKKKMPTVNRFVK